MKRLSALIAITLIVVFAISVSGTAHAKNYVRHYKVTITNITRGQIISPPIVISHNHHFSLFRLGDSATPELAKLAEEGNTMPLEGHLSGLDSVYDYNTASGPIMPGAFVTVEIKTKRGFQHLSAAGMLVTTNDAFMAIRGTYARSWEATVVSAAAYDAGSEVNTETCDSIPGPPCAEDSGNMRNTDGAEGYVYIHSGIHDIGDLDPAELDWLNPVATVKIERLK